MKETVLITGASGGIGYELAKCFAMEGYALVLVARSGERLREIKKEFERMFNVKVAGVNIVNTMGNKKKASIKLRKEFKASDVAIKLKLV